MNKKNFFAAVLLTLFAFSVNVGAKSILPTEALKKAGEFWVSGFEFQVSSFKSQVSGVQAVSEPVLAYTAQQGDEVHFYVYNYPDGGWVMIGGDDVCKDVLAYSYTGSFKYENCPENVKGWLKGYEMEIAACIKYVAEQEAQGVKVPRMAVRTASKGDKINAMIKTHWNQTAPYWNMCPKQGSKTCYTGCVATAMAQVMYYNKWPKVGVGSKTYTDTYGCGQKLSTTFSDHTYAWDDMKLETSQFNTTASKNAVAQLMYDCGVSVSMMYTNEGSGAYSEDVAPALINFFNYDKNSVKYVMKSKYSDEMWASMIYEDLALGHTIVYSGVDGTGPNAGGHEFVCDGYEYKSSADYFHFNFGWSGENDGFYTLKTVGPTGYQFKYDQDAVIGVVPNVPQFYTVTLDDDSTKMTPQVAGGSIELPTRSMEGYTFKGWSSEDIKEMTTSAPKTLLKGTYTPLKNVKLYPVYSLTVEKKGEEPVEIFSEDFSSAKEGDNTTTSGSSNEWVGNANFKSVFKVNQAGGAVRLGSSRSRGYLTTKALNIAIGNTVSVSFDVKGWTTKEGDVHLQLGQLEATETYTNLMADGFESKTVTFVAEEADCSLEISSTSLRLFIDNISVVVGGPSKVTYYFTHHSIPTSINKVETTKEVKTDIYNLNGQKIQKLQKGFNIVNGKKVIFNL